MDEDGSGHLRQEAPLLQRSRVMLPVCRQLAKTVHYLECGLLLLVIIGFRFTSVHN